MIEQLRAHADAAEKRGLSSTATLLRKAADRIVAMETELVRLMDLVGDEDCVSIANVLENNQ